ncbi:MAG: hypothetical protein NPIRA05_07320 [Nitrospirales bacterium]|nr:MAG: hypothetical protein NPIRA05_07320 [Nitrospirales bacterium]
MGCFNQWSRANPLSGTSTKNHYAYLKGISVGGIANQRGLATSTINEHLEQAIQACEPVDHTQLWTPEQELEMTGAFEKTVIGYLTGAKEILGDLYDYGQLRLFRAVHGEK